MIALLKANDVEVRLLHVLEQFPVPLAEIMGSKDCPDFVAARLKLRNQASGFLEQTADKLRSAGFETCYWLEEGDAREIILDDAERCAADLIIVGSHGRKGMNRFLMGSVSEAVAHYARCSVQIVRVRSDY
jgi:nucleotide-binding universal stress UspA family protein